SSACNLRVRFSKRERAFSTFLRSVTWRSRPSLSALARSRRSFLSAAAICSPLLILLLFLAGRVVLRRLLLWRRSLHRRLGRRGCTLAAQVRRQMPAGAARPADDALVRDQVVDVMHGNLVDPLGATDIDFLPHRVFVWYAVGNELRFEAVVRRAVIVCRTAALRANLDPCDTGRHRE